MNFVRLQNFAIYIFQDHNGVERSQGYQCDKLAWSGRILHQASPLLHPLVLYI